MKYLNWELTVLNRSVAYENLSGAASQIGMSQPQLSRIVAKLEEELGLTLLNRDAKRKSSWTPAAMKLAEIYASTFQQFQVDVRALTTDAELTTIRIGTLEGLTDKALELCERLFTKTAVETIELVVADLDYLEERYYKGKIEFLLTSREPGKKKHKNSRVLGYQSLKSHGKASGIKVLSTFENATALSDGKRKSDKRTFISNSLPARRKWIEDHDGVGVLPSEIRSKKQNNDDVPVIFLGLDHLPAKLWAVCMS